MGNGGLESPETQGDVTSMMRLKSLWTGPQRRVCSQLSHPCAVSEAEQKGVRTQHPTEDAGRKWEQDGLLGRPAKSKACTAIPPIS